LNAKRWWQVWLLRYRVLLWRLTHRPCQTLQLF
jgi:hypothetical protein